MKILMMVLMVAVAGCTVDDIEDIESVEDIDISVNDDASDKVIDGYSPTRCSQFSEYREIVEITGTTYQITKNTCNSIKSVTFRPDGTMFKIRKVVDTHWGEGELVEITYSYDGFYYRDSTVGRYQDTGAQALDYDYVNGDNFIAVTQLPAHYVRYIYEGTPEFDKIIQDALYEVNMVKVRDVISAP